MSEKNSRYLSKREQQIMEIIYRQGSVTAPDLETQLPGAPANSTVRTLLRILEQKGHIRHEKQEGRQVFFATQPQDDAGKTALGNIVETFFKGSVPRTVSALLGEKDLQLSDQELDDLQALIDQARKEEPKP